MNDCILECIVSGIIAATLGALWLLLQFLASQTPELATMRRYHSIWIFNAFLLFSAQVLTMQGWLVFPAGLLGFWGVVSFALVPLSFFLHIVSMIPRQDG